MKKIGFIPARMAASRFPGKPLAPILNLPMIEHVRRRVCMSPSLDDVYVATCDKEIFQTVTNFGGKAIMTSPDHERCTDRVREAAGKVKCDIAVIIQGDEPLFLPEIIDPLVDPLLKDETILCTNLISTISDTNELSDIDVVKVVLDPNGRIIYYSRAPIPYQRVSGELTLFRQTGFSAFRTNFLHLYSDLPPTPLEIAESIDFLRIIENRYSVLGVIYPNLPTGVDRPDDIGQIEHDLLQDPRQIILYQSIK